MKYFLPILLFVSTFTNAQENGLPYFLPIDNIKYARTDSALESRLSKDTLSYSFNKDSLKFYCFYKNGKVCYEGKICRACVDCLGKDGEWKKYYENDKLEFIGNYDCNKPIGIWKYFYENGNIKIIENYKLFNVQDERKSIKVGDYKEYYENGQLKAEGKYSKGNVIDSLVVYSVEAPYLATQIPVKSKGSTMKGKWRFYNSDGSLIIETKF